MFQKLLDGFIIGRENSQIDDKFLERLRKSPEDRADARRKLYGMYLVFGSKASQSWLDANFIQTQRKIRQRLLFRMVSRVAAVVVVLLSLGGILWWQLTPASSLEWNKVVLGRGEHRTILLPDSSKVTLAPASTFEYPNEFSETTRRVMIDGEAYFEIRKNNGKPFIVETPRSLVQVTGTSFNLRSYTADWNEEVMLVEGGVDVRYFSTTGGMVGKCTLTPYRKALFNKAKNTIEVNKFDVSERPLWMNGTLSFRDVRFDLIAKILERHYNVDIVFNDEALRSLKLNGDFKNETIVDILEAIKILTPYDYNYNQNTQTIYLSAYRDE